MSQVQNGTKEMLPDKRTYTVKEVAHILGIGRTSALDRSAAVRAARPRTAKRSLKS